MIRSYLHLKARPGARDELLNTLDTLEVMAAIRAEAGFLAAEIQVPFDADDDVLVVGSWASREHYDRWREGTSRGRMLDAIADLLAKEPESRVYHLVDTIEAG